MVSPPSLDAQLQHLRAVLDEIGAYVFTKDLQGRYTFVNALCLQLFQRPLEQVLGHDDAEFFDLAASTEVRDNDRRVLESGEALEREEVNIVRATGETRVYWAVKKPLRDAQGQVIGLCGIATDITARKRVEAELAEQRTLLDAVLANLPAHVYMKDAGLRYVFVNASVAQLFGRPVNGVIGCVDADLMPASEAAHLTALDAHVLASGQVQSAEESFADADGMQRHYWSVKLPIRWQGAPALLGFSSDISELHQLKEQLRLQSISDGLTGLHNRRHFQEAGRRELARAQRHGQALSLLLLDIDRFKRINDRYGHPAGDLVLQQVAALMLACVRGEDLLARVGGEEFALLLPETSVEAARPLAERIRAGVEALRVDLDDGRHVKLSVSIGLAQAQGSGDSLDPLYSRADQQLYAAKRGGRNRVCG